MYQALRTFLAFSSADVEAFGLLRFMRMLGAGVDAQVRHLATASGLSRKHALDGLFQHALGEVAVEDLARGALLDAARMSRCASSRSCRSNFLPVNFTLSALMTTTLSPQSTCGV